MSDNICFPAKLVHSHIAELDRELSDFRKEDNTTLTRIFFPYVVYEKKDDDRTDGSYNCPIVSAYSDVIRSSMTLSTQMDSPVITFADERLLWKGLEKYLATLGVGHREGKIALKLALADQRVYENEIKRIDEKILADSRKEKALTILLAGRPYHADPLIQHKLSDMIAGLGVNVITDDIVRGDYAARARRDLSR